MPAGERRRGGIRSPTAVRRPASSQRPTEKKPQPARVSRVGNIEMKNDGKSGNEGMDGLDARDDAALWDLLGRAPAPQAGPYFARRVLREVALHEEAHPAVAGVRWWQPASLWRTYRRLVFVAGAPVAALLLLFLGLRLNPVGRPAVPGRVVAETLPVASQEDDTSADTDPLAAPDDQAASADPAVPDDISAQDVEVIADLDNLLKREESRSWTEDDTTTPSARF